MTYKGENKMENQKVMSVQKKEALFSTKSISKMAMVTALYVVLTILISPLSYGFIQVRLSEMFNYLGLYHQRYILAITLGVAIANLNSPLGIVDVIVGSVSTYIVLQIVVFVAKRFKQPWQKLICVPIIFSLSMFTVAAQISILGDAPFKETFFVNWFVIGMGELVSLLIGLGVIYFLSRNDTLKKLLDKLALS